MTGQPKEDGLFERRVTLHAVPPDGKGWVQAFWISGDPPHVLWRRLKMPSTAALIASVAENFLTLGDKEAFKAWVEELSDKDVAELQRYLESKRRKARS